MSNYARMKPLSRTVNNMPSLTDQAAANDTDRNVIVKKFMIHGQVPTGTKQPMYADFSRFPEDLQGFLKQAQSINRLRGELPDKLKELTLEALLALTPEQLNERLKPAELPLKKEGETK